MNQPDPKQSRTKLQSSSWTIAVMVFLAIYLVLQWQQTDRRVEQVAKQNSETHSGELTGQKTLPL